MPIYEYSNGEMVIERLFRSYEDSPEVIEIDGENFERIFSVPFMSPDPYWSGHYSVTYDKHITSRSELKELEKKSNAEQYDGEYAAKKAREEKKRKRKKADKKRKESVSETVRDLIY